MIESYNWDNFRIRCSAIHSVLASSRSNPCLTQKQANRLVELNTKETLTDKMKAELSDLLQRQENSAKVVLSESCISVLIDEWAWQKEGMVRVSREILDVPQMQKGILVEFESLLLLSKVDGVIYSPNVTEDNNRERFYNKFLSGEPDAWAGSSFIGTDTVPDIKSIWDRPTFLNKIEEPLSRANEWQIKGYMDISGAKRGFIANCLINTPHDVVEKVRWKLLNKFNAATDENSEFKETWALIERSMNFDHIPDHQKVFKKEVDPMTNHEREILYDRVKACREWLFMFDEKMQNLNLFG